MPKQIYNSRAIATRISCDIIKNKISIEQSLIKNQLFAKLSAQDQSFTKALCFGLFRWYLQLEFIMLNVLVKQKKPQLTIRIIIMLGILQLKYLEVPKHAAISETVNIAKILNLNWATGLINAVLRRYLTSEIDLPLMAKYAHPTWLIELIRLDWPQSWQNILENNNNHPPCTTRLNINKVNKKDYLTILENLNIKYQLISEIASAIIFTESKPPNKLPGFTEGSISIQDGAAQLAAYLLNTNGCEKVLDACAAPGGKTCHLLEINPKIKLTSLDRSAQRLRKITANTKRLNLNITPIVADAKNLETWWDNQLFDKILLDAPCSALGVIRRHPDIKYLRTLEDISQAIKQQAELLDALWKTLKPNGILLYATCSILKSENDEQIKHFIKRHTNAVIMPIINTVGEKTSYGLQILPGDCNLDGFYYAKIKKQPIL